MTNEIFIDGDENITQLRVQGYDVQAEPLQTWENHAGDVLAQLTSDGRLELGDLDLATQDALIEANNDINLDATPTALQGIQSRGIIRRISGAIGDAIAWIVHELEFQGSGGISDEHTALRSKIINRSTGVASSATLQAGDFEAVIKEDSGGTGTAIGLRSAVTNETDAVLNTAVGAKIAITNAGQMQNAYGLVVDNMPDSANVAYSIVTGNAPVSFGAEQELKVLDTTPTDNPPTGFIKLYPKVEAGSPKLYAKDWAGEEYDLSSAKHNPNASSDPTMDDDGIDGYSAGSLWLNVSADKAFICLDNTAGAAVWLEITGSGSSSLADLSDVASASQQPNLVLATPNGSAGSYQGRALVVDDIPDLNASKIAAGILNNSRINWASPGEIGGSVPNTGTFSSLTVQPSYGNAYLIGDAPDENWRGLYLRTSGHNRWTLLANTTPESGNDSGSNLDLRRYDDSHSPELVLRVTRSNGNVDMYHNLNVVGSLTKGSGTFRIDHPLVPTEKILSHGFVEAPRYDLIYRGTVILTNGMATVDLDEASNMVSGTWSALCQSPQLWLQNDTGFAPVRGVVDADGKLAIECQDKTSTDTISWLVVAERKDPFIRTLDLVDESGRLVPEQDKKPEGEEGEKLGSLIHQDAAERFNPNYRKV